MCKKEEFDKLHALMMEDKFVNTVEYEISNWVVRPQTFAATSNAINWIKTFCSPTSEDKLILTIDRTYKAT